jgi:hypothetical protein
MTKLEEALAKIPSTRKGSRCSIFALYGSIPEKERDALKKVIETDAVDRIPSLAISQAISSAYGLDVHRASIDRHRRKDCLCGRTGR